MGLHRLLGMRIGVPDPAGLAAFYGELGLTADGHGGFGGTEVASQVHVEEYPFRRLLEVRVGADDGRALDAVAERLDALGHTSRRVDGHLEAVEPHSLVTFSVHVTEALPRPTVEAPAPENRPGAVVRHNLRAPGAIAGPRPPRRLGHLVLGTPDFAGTRRFVVDGLGFKVSDEMDGIMSFLRCSTDHHNLALVGSPVPLLQHYSWECDDVDHVGHAATRLVRADESRHAWGFGRHYLGSNYYWYLRDAAGSFLELYSDLDVIDDDEAWERNRTAFGFEHLANSWGPNLPAEFIEPLDLPELRAAWAARS